MNRICINFKAWGLVPLCADIPYTFVTSPPRKIGDDSIIVIKGKKSFDCRTVRLLRSEGHLRNDTYLVG